MIVLGIDLGLSGALACLRDGKPLWVRDMPTSIVAVGKRTRGTYDVGNLINMALEIQCTSLGVHANGTSRMDPVSVVCEDIYHLGFRGSLAARVAGIGWGMVIATAALYEWPLVAVAPSQWKRVVLEGRAKGKGAARARAAELFPGVDLGKRTDEGRAEALLLAWYGWRRYAGGIDGAHP